MHELQPVPARSGVTQVPHVQLPGKSVIHALEYLGNGILALGPFTKHILLAGRGIQVDTGNAGTLLSTVVLLLHHQIEFVKPVAVCAVLMLIVVRRLQQANHGHATLMPQLFH